MWWSMAVLLIAAALSAADGEKTLQEENSELIQAVKEHVRLMSRPLREVQQQALWNSRNPDFLSWVKEIDFSEAPAKTLFTGDFLQSIEQRLKRIEEAQTDINRRLTQTEGVTEQLQCGASERLEPVCKPPLEWVTVVVGGETNERPRSSTVQVFSENSSVSLPNFPVTVGFNRVTSINSKVFTCGGFVNERLSRDCHMIDIYEINKTWQKSYQLPRAIYRHYMSGANDAIMVIYPDGSLSVNSEQNSTTYESVFSEVSRDWHSCLASNSTHSFYVHLGNVYINNDASDPAKWKIVSELDIDVNYSGKACLLFGSELFVTQRKQLFIMNTNTFAVREGGSLNIERYFHGMGIIDGRVAVLGGCSSEPYADMKYDSIETYDHHSDTWHMSHKKMSQPVYKFGIVSLFI